MFSVLGLLAFVLYAKHRSSMVYRATEDYENAYDRMLSVMVRTANSFVATAGSVINKLLIVAVP